jgi:hypothetical protein
MLKGKPEADPSRAIDALVNQLQRRRKETAGHLTSLKSTARNRPSVNETARTDNPVPGFPPRTPARGEHPPDELVHVSLVERLQCPPPEQVPDRAHGIGVVRRGRPLHVNRQRRHQRVERHRSYA